MEDLIKALTILSKYLNDYHKQYPTTCEHDRLWVHVDYTQVSADDLSTLEQLGFYPDTDLGNMVSYRFGSC